MPRLWVRLQIDKFPGVPGATLVLQMQESQEVRESTVSIVKGHVYQMLPVGLMHTILHCQINQFGIGRRPR